MLPSWAGTACKIRVRLTYQSIFTVQAKAAELPTTLHFDKKVCTEFGTMAPKGPE